MRFNTLEVLQGHISIPLRRSQNDRCRRFFRQNFNFFEKNLFSTKNHVISFIATLRLPSMDMYPWNPSKVLKCIYEFWSPKKVFWERFGTSRCHFLAFEIQSKNRYFGDFFPKTAWKVHLLHLSSAKKGATMHFKRLKILFLKNSAKIDDFCTLCELLTPNAKKFIGGTLCTIIASIWCVLLVQTVVFNDPKRFLKVPGDIPDIFCILKFMLN